MRCLDGGRARRDRAGAHGVHSRRRTRRARRTIAGSVRSATSGACNWPRRMRCWTASGGRGAVARRRAARALSRGAQWWTRRAGDGARVASLVDRSAGCERRARARRIACGTGGAGQRDSVGCAPVVRATRDRLRRARRRRACPATAYGRCRAGCPVASLVRSRAAPSRRRCACRARALPAPSRRAAPAAAAGGEGAVPARERLSGRRDFIPPNRALRD